jgi:hypothetical protein
MFLDLSNYPTKATIYTTLESSSIELFLHPGAEAMKRLAPERALRPKRDDRRQTQEQVGREQLAGTTVAGNIET